MLKTSDKRISALSWKISTEPKLYMDFADNPFSEEALLKTSKRFPNESNSNITRAIILAEPEGRYDGFFKQLPYEFQKAYLCKQIIKTAEITRRLNKYYEQHSQQFEVLPSDLIYGILFKIAFDTTDLQEVRQSYTQNQRMSIKLLILNLTEKAQNLKSNKKHALIFSRKVFAVLSSVSFFFLVFMFINNQIVHGQSRNTAFTEKATEQVLPADPQNTVQSYPARLIIPSINVDASVEQMGLTPSGIMAVPDNAVDVGWYKLGPKPGATGSAVIAGHFDGKAGKSGVFNNLDNLKQGDKIYVKNNTGSTTTFVVRESRSYSPGYVDEVFYPNDKGIHLNLITCDGVWDVSNKSYSKRLVIFADITNQ